MRKKEKACFLHGWFVLYEPLLHLCIQGEEAQTLRSPTPKGKIFLVPDPEVLGSPGSGAVIICRYPDRIRVLASTSKKIKKNLDFHSFVTSL
jgi:hypothetical protein